MATPNLGLVIPVGGTTPGAADNITPGTYPDIWAANLGLIDSLCYSLNNPAVPAGININANLPFNGNSITGLNSLTATGTIATSGNATVGGTLGVTGATTLSSLTVTGNESVDGILGATSVQTTGDISVGGILQATAADSSLTLQGNSSDGSTTGLILNTGSTTLTSGIIAAFANNSNQLAFIDWEGTFNGFSLVTSELSITPSGHIIPTGTAPTVVYASFATSFGIVTPGTSSGSDAAFTYGFASGTYSGTPTPAGTKLFTVTLNTAYSNDLFIAHVQPQVGTEILKVAGNFYAVPTAAGTFDVFCSVPFTPGSSTQYEFSFMTMGAGATA